MTTNEKIRPYIFIFLLFCVFSSKNILIYNEETLVALSFLCFTFFIFHYFGNTIKDSLNQRSLSIQQELQNFLVIKQDSLNVLLKQHNKIFGLSSALKNMELFTYNELIKANLYGEKALITLFNGQFQSKLKTLALSKITLQQKLQEIIAHNIFGNVLVEYQQLKTQKQDQKYSGTKEAMNNAIQLLLKNIKR